VRYIKLKESHSKTCSFSFLSNSPLRCLVLHLVLVFGAVTLGGDAWMLKAGGFVNPLLPETYPLVEKFIRWDAHWYTYIAQQGYGQMSIVFFPMLIMWIRIVAPLLNFDYGLAGFIVCNAFGVLCFFLLYALFRLDFSETVADKALLAFAVMPSSVFLNSIYTESLFLTFSLACVYFARTGRWWRAGLCAAMATLTRNLGVFLICLIAWEYWEQGRGKDCKLSRLALTMALPLLAFAGYIYYNYWLLGQPLAFVEMQKAWGREFSPPWVNIWHGALLVWQGAGTAATLDFFLVVLTLAGILMMTIRPTLPIPRSYLIIGSLWLLVPLCSTSAWMPLYSMSRFILVIFPLYLFLAQLQHSRYCILIMLGAVTTAICSILFTNWFWLG